MSTWVQHGEKVYTMNTEGELTSRVCVATNSDRAAEIIRMRQACVDGACHRARKEFVRGAFMAMEALAASGLDATEACRRLGVTAAEAEEVARGSV